MQLKRIASRIVLAVFGVGLAGALPLVAFSGKLEGGRGLPPVGQRAYLLGEDPFAPVAIERVSGAKKGARFLKDPVQPSQVPALTLAKRAAPVPRPRLSSAPRAGQLRFTKLTVAGHLTRPRVEFTRDLLPVDRADEPVGQDFFPKVFAPATDDSF